MHLRIADRVRTRRLALLTSATLVAGGVAASSAGIAVAAEDGVDGALGDATQVDVLAEAPEPRVEPAPNPQLPGNCGIKLALVLDASGSMQIPGLDAVRQVRSAADAFLGSFTETGTTASVLQFATRAEVLAPYTEVTEDSVGDSGPLGQALESYYDSGSATGRPVPPGDTYQYLVGDPLEASSYDKNSPPNDAYTNWYDALRQTDGLSGAEPPDLVVVVTDGRPTAVNAGLPGLPFQDPDDTLVDMWDSLPAELVALNPAIEMANAIKGEGTKILSLGVGLAFEGEDNVKGLQAISGTTVTNVLAGEVPDITSDDVILTTDFEALQPTLRFIATQLCNRTVTVTKLAQSPGSTEYLPASGWEFTATPDVTVQPGLAGDPEQDATLSQWLLPEGIDGTPASVSATTDDQGQVRFQWDTDPPLGLTEFTLDETPQEGYVASGVTCSITNPLGELDQFPDFPAEREEEATSLPFTFTIVPGDIADCEVRNDAVAPAIDIVKTASASSVPVGGEVTYTYTVTNTGAVVLAPVTVADDKCEPVTPASVASLEPGASTEFTCTTALTENTTNVAVTTGQPPSGPPVTAQDTATVTVQQPTLPDTGASRTASLTWVGLLMLAGGVVLTALARTTRLGGAR